MINFDEINDRALSCLPDLLTGLLPGGRINGNEFKCGDIAGNPGKSFSVNLTKGVWTDFAPTEKGKGGNDPVSLVAAVRGISQGDAAKYLADHLGATSLKAKKIKPVDHWQPAPTATAPESIHHPRLGKPSATWAYRNKERLITGYDCRFDSEGEKKQVLPLTHFRNTATSETKWMWKGQPAPRPLYGLDQLVARPEAPVISCEGCKATDAAQSLIPGAVAVTWPGGCGAVTYADYSPMAGRRVAIWPDADECGMIAAETVAQNCLSAGATEVFIIDPPPGKAIGWDAADALAEGWTVEQTSKWIQENKRAVLAREEVTLSGEEWPEPSLLPDELLPVAPFDFDLLPESLQAWAKDICDRLQCPPDFVACGFMTSMSSIIGLKVGIRPQRSTDWTVVCNLWALIVGRPGVLKSPALEAALSPLKRLISKALIEHEAVNCDFQTEQAVFKLQMAAKEKEAMVKLRNDSSADITDLLRVDATEPPTLKRYMVNDSTPAALGELLRQNSNGLLVYRDELVSLLKGLDREDQAEGRGFYLTAWNGDSSYTFDRIGRGMNLHIPSVCLSILGGTQPGRLSEYIREAVKGGAADDGLIQRFGLMVWPDTGGTWKNVDRYPNADAKNQAFKVFEYLDSLDIQAIEANQDTTLEGEPDGIPYLRFSPEGLELFTEWRVVLEARLRSGELPPALESHFAKYRSLVPSLALILHIAAGGIGPVSETATLQALGWSEYLETHAMRAYTAGLQPKVATAKAILKRIKKGDLPASFSSKEVWRPGWSGLSDSADVNEALNMLLDYGYLRTEQKETGGRTATIFHAHGSLLS